MESARSRIEMGVTIPCKFLSPKKAGTDFVHVFYLHLFPVQSKISPSLRLDVRSRSQAVQMHISFLSSPKTKLYGEEWV